MQLVFNVWVCLDICKLYRKKYNDFLPKLKFDLIHKLIYRSSLILASLKVDFKMICKLFYVSLLFFSPINTWLWTSLPKQNLCI